MGKIRGGAKVLRGMKQEADGKALMDTRLRTAGRRLIDQGRTEFHRRPRPTDQH
ncbi:MULTISPECIES: hypothetical protein [Streptomyces]|uniref:hypothetical protein n=1 Tax=Streptomyces TaxID=1883 RepID=UPI002271CC6A|nr:MULTISPECIES: hypothetical protein [unclassified Streptomyces]MCY0944951.1 hypothetical protein [Streptomyces sp. H34-AA3]MCY0951483.1 hypothetical protein [Streptomyces sp. H27-S2]MCZ4082123.1 hypothetical protein [Streptomyces sp. H34-S5]